MPGLKADLVHRRLQPELMDDPSIDPEVHSEALRGLARLNRASRIVRTVRRELDELVGSEPVSVLDVAAGSGDLVVGLAKREAGTGTGRRYAACDISETACSAILRRAADAGTEVAATRVDALHDSLPEGHDVVMCHLFVHHLVADDIVLLLERMKAAARRAVLVTDLIRSPMGYRLAWLASRMLTNSPVVHTDALRSVEGALTPDEFRALAERAGLGECRIHRAWPERIVLRWTR